MLAPQKAFGYGLTIVNNEQELSYSIVYLL